MNHDDNGVPVLTRSQRRILLWLPIIGFWCVLTMIARRPEEGGIDWPSFLMMGITCTGVLVGLWFAMGKLVGAKRSKGADADQPVSRAEMIYGKSEHSDGASQEDET